MSLRAAKRRRAKRRAWREITLDTCEAWGVSPVLSNPSLRKRLLEVIQGREAPDSPPCFWYHPESHAFKRIDDPGRQSFVWVRPSRVGSVEFARNPEIYYVGHAYGLEYIGIDPSMRQGRGPYSPRYDPKG